MKIVDKTKMFLDNAQRRTAPNYTLVVHWTGGSTASGAIEHLNKRAGGEGSVGYNAIIDKDGTVYLLADPRTHWMHNTGKGTSFDRKTISVSFVALPKDKITVEQIRSFRKYKMELEEWCNISVVNCHKELNPNKPDFPAAQWEELYKELV